MARRGNLRKSTPPRRKAKRPSDPGADKIPDGDKPQSRKSDRLVNVAGFCIPRRRGDRMRRRDFIALFGGAVAPGPLTARGGHPALPVVGFLHSASPYPEEAEAFGQGLKEAGFVDGKNVTIEFRGPEGHRDRLPVFATDLVHRQVSVIAAIGGDVTALAAKAATSTIPIVFLNGSDSLKSRLVASINRPGGNITGVSLFAGTVDAKRLELLHVLVPHVTAVAVFNNALVAETEARSKSLAEAAAKLGLQLVFFNIAGESDFDTVFDDIAKQKIGALFVSGSPYFISRRDQLRLPANYGLRENCQGGGLDELGSRCQGRAS